MLASVSGETIREAQRLLAAAEGQLGAKKPAGLSSLLSDLGRVIESLRGQLAAILMDLSAVIEPVPPILRDAAGATAAVETLAGFRDLAGTMVPLCARLATLVRRLERSGARFSPGLLQQIRVSLSAIKVQVDALPTVDVGPIALAVEELLAVEKQSLELNAELAADAEHGWADYQSGRWTAHSSASELIEALDGVAPRKD